MSFLYPRTIAITRPAVQTGAGYQPGYAGQTQASETPVAGTIDPTTRKPTSGLAASIQPRREGQNNPVSLPATGTNVRYHIYVPKRAAPLGLINDNDIVTDDQARRYQVLDSGWDSMGYRMTCVLLTA